MKKYLLSSLKLIPIIGVLTFAISCSDIEDDDFYTEGGSVLYYTNIVNGFFDLGDLDNTSIGFDVLSGGEPISNIVITKSFNGAAGSFGPIEHTSGPTGSYTITVDEALSGLGITSDQIEVGDSFTFTSTSGVVTKSISINASCVSELAGTYSAVSVGTSTDVCCPDETTVTSEVILESTEGGKYTISDFSGGLYFEWYDIYGITPTASPGDIEDVCNSISLLTDTEPFGETLTGSGTVDPETGVITLSWVSGFGDQGVSTLTPM